MTDIESRTDPAPARTTSGSTPSSTGIVLASADLAEVVPQRARAAPAGTGSGASGTGWSR